MKERINRLAKGIIDMDTLRIKTDRNELMGSILPGQISRGEIDILDEKEGFMKGLVYSSNVRVRVLNESFGGVRNKIAFEIDGTHLTKDEVIKGNFFLVTNGGEKTIPFQFRSQMDEEDKKLLRIQTVEHFKDICIENEQLSMKFLDSPYFENAPFMKESKIQNLYDGLKTHLKGKALLDEFFLALKLIQPVKLHLKNDILLIEREQDLMQGVIEVQKDKDGYTEFSVQAKTPFLAIVQKNFTEVDFIGNTCKIPYFIRSECLHSGKNYGTVDIVNNNQSLSMTIEIDVKKKNSDKEKKKYPTLYKYWNSRLDYESDCYEKSLLISQMKRALDDEKNRFGEHPLLLLLQAELHVMEGQLQTAAIILNSVKDMLDYNYSHSHDLEGFHAYLMACIDGKSDSKITAKLKLERGKSLYSLLLLSKLDLWLEKKPLDLLEKLEALFGQGHRSPLLYFQGFQIYKKYPDMIVGIGKFEIQVLNFALNKGLIQKQDQQLMNALIRGFSNKHVVGRITQSVLKRLYEVFQDDKMLCVVCTNLIEEDVKEIDDFYYYGLGIKNQIDVPILYEQYLRALPDSYQQLLPKEVLLYFSYKTKLDENSRMRLYNNILTYANLDSDIYQQYEREMEKFAVSQLLQENNSEGMSKIYQAMIYPSMIDNQIARVLPQILFTKIIKVNQSAITHLVLRYESINHEEYYCVRDGQVNIPIFTDCVQLFFQDEKGKRYVNVSWDEKPLIDDMTLISELEQCCIEKEPNHQMLKRKATMVALNKEKLDDSDVLWLHQELEDPQLENEHNLRHQMTVVLMTYYTEKLDVGGVLPSSGVGFLLNLDLKGLQKKERVNACELLIRSNYTIEAYDIIKSCGWEGIKSKYLLDLCSKMVHNQLFEDDNCFLQIICKIFTDGINETNLLELLCSKFNGSSRQMFRILRKSKKLNINTHDLPERLLAQMMFTSETYHMDETFQYYAAEKRINENVMKAYFTLKSYEYFLQDKEMKKQVFIWLEEVVQKTSNLGRIPIIHLMALSKYYSEQKNLSEVQIELCQSIVNLLLEEDKVFGYFKKLESFISIPDSIRAQTILEYKGVADSKPKLVVKMEEEEKYHLEDLKRVYPGVFIHLCTLFQGEELEYQIYETVSGTEECVADGKIVCEKPTHHLEDNRYGLINEIVEFFNNKSDALLEEKMKQYLHDVKITEKLFSKSNS